MTDYSQHRVLDLFAGHGVGVAIRNLGATEFGVEWNPAAVATRELNGMETLYSNVWDAHLAEGLQFDTLWASPPCQQFSLAGAGAGRRALDDVLGVIHRGQYTDMAELREQSDILGDEKIGLVLTPLHYVHRFRPEYVAFEQVPPVLPVWEAMAEEMRGWGYSVWTGKLHAEQFGVPQTRTRAILMARLHGEVVPPVPTHSKYYSRDPERLDEGVQKWVSMEEALGWGDRVLVSNQNTDKKNPEIANERQTRGSDKPSLTMTSGMRSGIWSQKYTYANYGTKEPTQAEGIVDGKPYYFRARWGKWTLEVGESGWPEDYSEWPGQGSEVANGEDETGGWMEDAAVRAILDAQFNAGEVRAKWPDNRPSPTVTGGGTSTGGAEPFGPGGRNAIRKARREQLR